MDIMKGFRRLYNLAIPYSPVLTEEPLEPILRTSIPGPKAQALFALTKEFSQDYQTVMLK
jgi:hypothetical protein